MKRFAQSPTSRASLLMLGFLLTAWLGLGPATAFPADPDVFDRFAAEIDSDIAWTLGPTGQRRPLRIAIWPRPTDPDTISLDLSEAYNDALLAALVRRDAASFRFVDPDILTTLSGDAGENADDALASVLRHTDADVLLIPEFRRGRGGDLVLSYKAVRVDDGGVLAVTSQRRLEAVSTISEYPGSESLAEEWRVTREPAPAIESPSPVDFDSFTAPDYLDPLASAPSPRVVRGVQRDLGRLGYDPGSVDGVIGTQTRTAVRVYQRDSGMPADGVISFDLIQNLNRDLVRMVEESLSEHALSEPEQSDPEFAQQRAIILPGWRESTANGGPRWTPRDTRRQPTCGRCHQFPPRKPPLWNGRVRARICPW